MEGSFVVRCYDGPSAFREEAARLERRDTLAQAVVSRDGGETWRLVPWGSTVRPDPRPPRRPRRVGLLDRLGRGGSWLAWLAARVRSKPDPFGRRRV